LSTFLMWFVTFLTFLLYLFCASFLRYLFELLFRWFLNLEFRYRRFNLLPLDWLICFPKWSFMYFYLRRIKIIRLLFCNIFWLFVRLAYLFFGFFTLLLIIFFRFINAFLLFLDLLWFLDLLLFNWTLIASLWFIFYYLIFIFIFW
jgi:hypothetical protein